MQITDDITVINITTTCVDTTWCRQEDGTWRNEDAHSWAINYGGPDDEDVRTTQEMQNEVDFCLNCGRTVTMH